MIVLFCILIFVVVTIILSNVTFKKPKPPILTLDNIDDNLKDEIIDAVISRIYSELKCPQCNGIMDRSHKFCRICGAQFKQPAAEEKCCARILELSHDAASLLDLTRDYQITLKWVCDDCNEVHEHTWEPWITEEMFIHELECDSCGLVGEILINTSPWAKSGLLAQERKLLPCIVKLQPPGTIDLVKESKA